VRAVAAAITASVALAAGVVVVVFEETDAGVSTASSTTTSTTSTTTTTVPASTTTTVSTTSTAPTTTSTTSPPTTTTSGTTSTTPGTSTTTTTSPPDTTAPGTMTTSTIAATTSTTVPTSTTLPAASTSTTAPPPPSTAVTSSTVPPTTTAPPTTTTIAPTPLEPPEEVPIAPALEGLPSRDAIWVPGSAETMGLGPDGRVPVLAFPVLGAVQFGDGWGLPRGHDGERRHEGTDIMGVAGQPLRAAFDGVVTRHQLDDRGIAGVVISITGVGGLRANYFHLNDDSPGTHDGAAPPAWRIPAAIGLGTRVGAGQIIGFMGDSGNAVGVPHLHFELRRPDGTPINPYPALVLARRGERCAEAFGPWANVGTTADLPTPVATVRGWHGATWLLGVDGRVAAVDGRASTVGRAGDC
jgi:murein DD-endopeptidase MepM/ murein hydrolase activator NlpD